MTPSLPRTRPSKMSTPPPCPSTKSSSDKVSFLHCLSVSELLILTLICVTLLPQCKPAGQKTRYWEINKRIYTPRVVTFPTSSIGMGRTVPREYHKLRTPTTCTGLIMRRTMMNEAMDSKRLARKNRSRQPYSVSLLAWMRIKDLQENT